MDLHALPLCSIFLYLLGSKIVYISAKNGEQRADIIKLRWKSSGLGTDIGCLFLVNSLEEARSSADMNQQNAIDF